MISQDISTKIGDAMKAHDEIRLSTLKLLASALNYERIAKQHELSSDEEIQVVKREAKKRKEAIEVYQKANAFDRVERETRELAILEEFLPEEMPDEDLLKLVNEAIEEISPQGLSDIGRVIGVVMKKSGGAAPGEKVVRLVKEKLS